jgi:hypothetical protein
MNQNAIYSQRPDFCLIVYLLMRQVIYYVLIDFEHIFGLKVIEYHRIEKSFQIRRKNSLAFFDVVVTE